MPKKKQTRSQRGKRRSHHAIKAKQLVSCGKCGTKIVAHQVCQTCRTYKGKEVQ